MTACARRRLDACAVPDYSIAGGVTIIDDRTSGIGRWHS
jgi:hypothetical protein